LTMGLVSQVKTSHSRIVMEIRSVVIQIQVVEHVHSPM